jgi:hypothetical protein
MTPEFREEQGIVERDLQHRDGVVRHDKRTVLKNRAKKTISGDRDNMVNEPAKQ